MSDLRQTGPVSPIGQSVARIDAPAKVTGAALYPGDITRPDMLHMATLFAGRPHARVLRIDTTVAEAAPGVVAVFTAADVPVNEYGLQINDQPVLCGPGSEVAGADVVRFVGDQVALMVAETEAQARAACALIHIEWEDLPLVLGVDAAMQPDAYRLHPERGEGNTFYSYRIRTGDVEAALRSADVVVEGVYHTPVQEHAYLQPEAGIAYIDDEGRVTVEVAGQWTHVDRAQIAHALGLPDEDVRVIYPAIGGAFGGREDMSVQITLALAVWRLAQRGVHRPVKTIWSREESIVGHGKRHAMTLRARWGATCDGKLVAAEVTAIADGGAYCYTSNKVLGNTTLTCTGPYLIPNVSVDTCAVYTNNVPGAAFRGFGGPQGHFAAESQMDRLAEALGMDPVEFRLRNVLTDNTPLATGAPIPGGVGLIETIEAAARAAGWPEHPLTRRASQPSDDLTTRRGVGFAAGYKNVGFSFGYTENSTARIELRGAAKIEEALVYFAGADVGQGHHTAVAQMAAAGLGIAPERVRVVASDTAQMGDSGSASASRLTYMAGNAVRGAAERALHAWAAEERPAVGEYTYLAPKTTALDHDTGQGQPNFAYGYVAQVVELVVDTETGQITVERIICADDTGTAINPQQVVGQIEGAVVQALGYALMEDFRTRDGHVLTNRLSTYLIPTVLDIPAQVESIIVETPDPNGPWGARGMGEMPYLPLAAAVANALYDATGVRFYDFPLTPERVWRGLQSLSENSVVSPLWASATGTRGYTTDSRMDSKGEIMIAELIARNRSYRRFHEDVPVTLDTLRELVGLARLTASARNMQSLRFILCSDRETNAAIFATLAWAGYLPDWPGPVEGERPAAYIVVLADETRNHHTRIDEGLALQSMLLGAVERGLGGCIIGSINQKVLRQALAIPDGLEIYDVLALGKPKETVVTDPVGPDGSIKYWREPDGTHHVPKRDLNTLIVAARG